MSCWCWRILMQLSVSAHLWRERHIRNGKTMKAYLLKWNKHKPYTARARACVEWVGENFPSEIIEQTFESCFVCISCACERCSFNLAIKYLSINFHNNMCMNKTFHSLYAPTFDDVALTTPPLLLYEHNIDICKKGAGHFQIFNSIN